MQPVTHVERAQMLVECASRAALQRFLTGWHEVLHEVRQRQKEWHGSGLFDG